MRKYRNRAALSLVLLAGLLVRLFRLTSMPVDKHYFRQTQTLGTIAEYVRHGVDLLHPTMASMGRPGVLVLEFPLYQAIVAWIEQLTVPSVVVARLASIAATLVAAYLVYRIAQLFWEGSAPVLAAAFFLFAPASIFYGRAPMLEMFEIMLCLGFSYFLAAYMIETRSWRYLVAGALIACAAFVVKPPYAAPFVVGLIYLYFATYGRRLRLDVIVSIALPTLVMVVWQRYANAANASFGAGHYPYDDLIGAIQVKLFPPNTWYFGTLAQRLDPMNYVKLAARIGVGILGVVGALPFVAGLARRFDGRERVVLAWLLAVLGSFFVFFNLNVEHDYYQVPLLPIAALVCARGVGVIAERLPACASRARARIAQGVVVAAALACIGLVMWKVGYYRPIGVPSAVVGAAIARTVPSDGLVAVSTLSGDLWDPSVLVYAGKTGFTVPQARIDAKMLDYLRESGVRWIAVSDGGKLLTPAGRQLLAPLSARPLADGLTIYALR